MGPGSGDISSITIPSIYIKSADGNKIKNYISNSKTDVRIIKKTNIGVSGLDIVPGLFFINDVIVRDNEGTSRSTLLLLQDYGQEFLEQGVLIKAPF